MTRLSKMIKESFGSEVLSISGGTVAGLVLASTMDVIEAFPGFIIMAPGFMGLRGNILGALSSRFGTGLHTGLIEPKTTVKEAAIKNFLASLFLSTFVNMLIGILAYFVSLSLGVDAVLWKLVLLGAMSGALASIVGGPFTIMLTLQVYQKGIDPDSVMGPIVTSFGDIVAVICLFLVAKLILWMG